MPESNEKFERDYELMEKLYRKYARDGIRVSRWKQSIHFKIKKALWIIVVGGSRMLKRGIDIIGSLFGLILLSPVFALTALAIKVEDRGPVFFASDRAGKWGKRFKMFKFRSMILEADQLKDDLLDQNETGGVIFKMKRDPRITRVGRLIRKLSIDELPQLYNVLRGDMSLVGPRPHPPKEVELYTLTDRRRLDATPGLTCFWQVSGRSDINFETQVRLDVQYIESQSLLGDLKLLLKTIPAVLTGRGAY
ncbi:MAG: sugar transferase [Desulfomonilaceae bacterium]|jgi:lipopolysaccharide/colanic/teichoic acid biosynthesis glycosyltransferase